MTIVQSFSTCLFKKYFSTQGRASPSEYWWFVFFTGLVHLCINVHVTNYIWDEDDVAWYHVFYLGVAVFLGLPWFAVAVRRVHDIDQPEFLGWLGALASLSCLYCSTLIIGGAYAVMETSINDVLLVLIVFVAFYYLLFCIVMGLAFFVMSVMDGTPGENKYGPNPLGVKAVNNFQAYGTQGFATNQGQNWGQPVYAHNNAQPFAQSNAQFFAQANGQPYAQNNAPQYAQPYQPYQPYAPQPVQSAQPAQPTNFAANPSNTSYAANLGGTTPANISLYQGSAPAQPSPAQQFAQGQPQPMQSVQAMQPMQPMQQGYNGMPPQNTMPSQMAQPAWQAPAQNSLVQPLAAPAAMAQATAATPEHNQQVEVPAPVAFNAPLPNSDYQQQLAQALEHPEDTPQVKLNAAELNQMDYVELTPEQSQQLQAMWRVQAQNTTNQP